MSLVSVPPQSAVVPTRAIVDYSRLLDAASSALDVSEQAARDCHFPVAYEQLSTARAYLNAATTLRS